MTNSISSITFYFPYHEVSGVPVLFSRMALYISEKCGVRTYVIDYPDGYMSQALKDTSVGFRHFVVGEKLHVSDDTILVMQAGFPCDWPEGLVIEPACRIVYWVLHPLNLVPAYLLRSYFVKHDLFHKMALKTILSPFTKNVKNLTVDMYKNRSLFFMDGSTFNFTTSRLGICLENPAYLPVPSDDAESNFALTRSKKQLDAINFCSIGRLCDFKVHILYHLMRRLSLYASKYRSRIVMHIIGDGPDAGLIRNCNLTNDYFSFKLLGTLSPKEVDLYLKENIDVVAAMGTSALESARLGIPTILLDFTYSPLEDDYIFKWIFEQSEYSLGDIITRNHCQRGNLSIDILIEQLKKQYEAVSESTYQYFINNHSLLSVTDKILSAIENSAFKHGDINNKLLRKSKVALCYELAKRLYYSYAKRPIAIKN